MRLTARIYGRLSGDFLDAYTFENYTIADVCDWFTQEFGGSDEFGGGYECRVFDERGEPLADFAI